MGNVSPTPLAQGYNPRARRVSQTRGSWLRSRLCERERSLGGGCPGWRVHARRAPTGQEGEATKGWWSMLRADACSLGVWKRTACALARDVQRRRSSAAWRGSGPCAPGWRAHSRRVPPGRKERQRRGGDRCCETLHAHWAFGRGRHVLARGRREPRRSASLGLRAPDPRDALWVDASGASCSRNAPSRARCCVTLCA